MPFEDIPERDQLTAQGVIGGLHLAGMHEPISGQTVEALRAFDLRVMAVGHCTGWRAVNALTSAFGDRVVAPCAVGERFVF
ncbi:MAG: hypothetical protein EXQ88_03275 [Alphaproteobacteria bacterium]|nr:hypothetical protein [Alphaproteobacteria bacterium]